LEIGLQSYLNILDKWVDMKIVKNILGIVLVGGIFIGCGDNDNNSTKPTIKLDGKSLLKQKCSRCHNIDFPPKNFEHELAPSMMTISFHFNDWFKANTLAERLLKQQDFVSDYVINPSVKKAYCDKKMLKRYGLMPSQKGKVTKDELRAIAKYVFTTYTQDKLSAKLKALEKLNSLPLGEQLTLKYRCVSCHSIDTKKVGPSFQDIGKKYKNNTKHIVNSITNGSKNRWKESRGATMPSFKNIDKNDIKELANWIGKLK
jgi:cytochrome c